MFSPISGNSLSFKDLAQEIKNSNSSTSLTDSGTILTGASRGRGRGRGRGRRRKVKESEEDFLGAGNLMERDETAEIVEQCETVSQYIGLLK